MSFLLSEDLNYLHIFIHVILHHLQPVSSSVTFIERTFSESRYVVRNLMALNASTFDEFTTLILTKTNQISIPDLFSLRVHRRRHSLENVVLQKRTWQCGGVGY